MYGSDVLCGISKGTFEIPHKISDSIHWKIWSLYMYIKILRALRFKSLYMFLKRSLGIRPMWIQQNSPYMLTCSGSTLTIWNKTQTNALSLTFILRTWAQNRHLRVHQGTRHNQLKCKQGKSQGSDSCDRPSYLTQIGFKSSIFQPVWPWNLMDDPEK